MKSSAAIRAAGSKPTRLDVFRTTANATAFQYHAIARSLASRSCRRASAEASTPRCWISVSASASIRLSLSRRRCSHRNMSDLGVGRLYDWMLVRGSFQRVELARPQGDSGNGSTWRVRRFPPWTAVRRIARILGPNTGGRSGSNSVLACAEQGRCSSTKRYPPRRARLAVSFVTRFSPTPGRLNGQTARQMAQLIASFK